MDASQYKLLSFSNLTPDWSIYNFERFPSIQWKLQNLTKLNSSNLEKFNAINTAINST